MSLVYVYEPSLMSIEVNESRQPMVQVRLGNLLHRFGFPNGSIETEMGYATEHVGLLITNTDMLAHINRLAEHISYWSGLYRSYSLLDETILGQDNGRPISQERWERIYQCHRILGTAAWL